MHFPFIMIQFDISIPAHVAARRKLCSRTHAPAKCWCMRILPLFRGNERIFNWHEAYASLNIDPDRLRLRSKHRIELTTRMINRNCLPMQTHQNSSIKFPQDMAILHYNVQIYDFFLEGGAGGAHAWPKIHHLNKHMSLHTWITSESWLQDHCARTRIFSWGSTRFATIENQPLSRTL